LQITVIPVVIFWFIQGVRAWDLAFFTAINPSIHMSGLYGTFKKDINHLLPENIQPRSVYLGEGDKNKPGIERAMRELGNSYPVILKPEIGERGLNVSKINNDKELRAQIKAVNGDIILQEYINYPLEISVLCYIHPTTGERDITSVCLKEFLSVTGNGKSTLDQLIDTHPRAILQRQRLSTQLDLQYIPTEGEKVILEPIGNHSRGTKFLNGKHLIDQKLKDVFLGILEKMEGIQFGRFDLRTKSVEDLKEGRNFVIIEFNGVNSEPIHIYDPSYPVWRAYYDQWKQWVLLRRIAMAQKKIGIKSQPQGVTFRYLLDYFNYIKESNLQARNS
jgi:hypothetical protein